MVRFAISRLLVGAVASLALVGLSLASDDLKKAFYMWQPVSVHLRSGVAVIKLPQPAITKDIYYATVEAGLCAFHSIGRLSLEGVQEICIVNRHGAQGFVLENPGEVCAAIKDAAIGKSDVLIAGSTRTYADVRLSTDECK